MFWLFAVICSIAGIFLSYKDNGGLLYSLAGIFLIEGIWSIADICLIAVILLSFSVSVSSEELLYLLSISSSPWVWKYRFLWHFFPSCLSPLPWHEFLYCAIIVKPSYILFLLIIILTIFFKFVKRHTSISM